MLVAPEPNVDARDNVLELVIQPRVDSLGLAVHLPTVLGFGEQLQE